MTAGADYRLIGIALLSAAGLAASFLLPSYLLYQASVMLTYAMAILGLVVLLGYTGQVSLAQGAFFALGAYAYAMLVSRAGMPMGLALLAAPALTVVAGVLVGLPALRLQGLQLAIVTFGLSALVPPLIIKLEHYTGGEAGIRLQQAGPPSWYGASTEAWTFTLCLCAFIACACISVRVLQGDSGRSLRAVRDNLLVAQAMGVHPVKVRLAAFAVSAAFAGLGGSLFALVNGIVNPSSFEASRSIEFLIGAVIGGLTSIAGAVIGSAFVVFVPDWAGRIDVSLAALLYGLSVIVVILYARTGIAGLVQDGVAALVRRRRPPLPSAPKAGTP